MINIYITHLSVFLLKFHLYNTVFKRERKKERKKEECYISFLNKIYLNIRIYKAELPFFCFFFKYSTISILCYSSGSVRRTSSKPTTRLYSGMDSVQVNVWLTEAATYTSLRWRPCWNESIVPRENVSEPVTPNASCDWICRITLSLWKTSGPLLPVQTGRNLNILFSVPVFVVLDIISVILAFFVFVPITAAGPVLLGSARFDRDSAFPPQLHYLLEGASLI